MFRLIAIILAATLCLPAAENAKRDPRTDVLTIPSGAMVRIKTTGKQTIEGRLNASTPESVTLQVLTNDQITERTVAFADMKSIRQTNKPMSAGKQTMIALGMVWGILTLISVAIGG
ncbi:MAG: hypothetical protein IPP47_11935 [Bryobacterales bacterium]|nr:hypothetical protein [Bryobacterales bacterium]